MAALTYNILLTLTVLCLQHILCQTTDLQYTIEEEKPAGVFVGNVANDANLDDKYGFEVLEELRYSFLQGQGPNKEISEILSIEEDTGIIRTATWVDREALCQQRQECSVKLDVAVTPSAYFEIITVQVEIRDINDHAPKFPSSQIMREISELARPGDRIDLPIAADEDSAEFGIDTYQLQSPSDQFDLDVMDLGSGVTSVQLVLKEALDRELVDFYQLRVLALDKGTSTINTGSVLVNITVVDGNDHRPYFQNATYSVSVPENFPVNRSIIRVQAFDADIGSNGLITYSFAPGTDSQITQAFGINSQNGQIYLKGKLDYENQVSYNLVIAARDGGENSQPALTTVIVKVQDLNDNSPQIAVNALTASGNAQISETSKVGTFVAHVSVVDIDAGINGDFSCKLDNNKFRLEKLQQTQYKIVTADVFNREEQSSYSVTVTCQDFGDPPNLSTEAITVSVLDENDHAPEFGSTGNLHAEIKENNHVNAFIIKINATDLDEGPNADITFSLHGSQAEYFTIHPKLGTVRAAYVFDYESIQRFEFQVMAQDNGVPPQSAVITLKVTVLDANDESPRFSQSAYEFQVVENQPIGMEIGIVQATDADSEPFNKIEYSIVPGKASQVFAIDTNSGHLRTRIHLDREQYSIYHMTILATNTGSSPPLSGTTEAVVTVKDENDNAPTIDFPNQQNKTVVISNLVPVGYKVGYIRAHDVDDDKNSKLMFSISGGNEGNSFLIDSQTGLITTNAKFDRMKYKSYDILISVGDHGFPQRLAVASLNITVDDSVPFEGPLENESLIGSGNLTIVLAVAIPSAIVVVVLLVAIVITILQIQRRRQGQSKWRLQMLKLWKEDGGANKESSSDDVIDSSSAATGGIAGSEIPIVTTDHTLQQQQHHQASHPNKQVSFNLKKSNRASHENEAFVSDSTTPAGQKTNPEVSCYILSDTSQYCFLNLSAQSEACHVLRATLRYATVFLMTPKRQNCALSYITRSETSHTFMSHLVRLTQIRYTSVL